jgi:sterol-4alpha-carboxylate 3-dehydrogenase (decarboxylating)
MASDPREVYLVIGGSGFVGRHIVDALRARGDQVAVFDIVQRYHDVPFYTGDIAEEGSITSALVKVRGSDVFLLYAAENRVQSGATCIIHTASPPHGVKDDALYWRVNVDGTRAVIDAAVASGVRKLVYTSSAGVVFDGQDLSNIDERLPPPERAMDPYNESKAKAESMVLEANGKGGLLTVALRPAGIFGFAFMLLVSQYSLMRKQARRSSTDARSYTSIRPRSDALPNRRQHQPFRLDIRRQRRTRASAGSGPSGTSSGSF